VPEPHTWFCGEQAEQASQAISAHPQQNTAGFRLLLSGIRVCLIDQ
jgi:hypothetical protein